MAGINLGADQATELAEVFHRPGDSNHLRLVCACPHEIEGVPQNLDAGEVGKALSEVEGVNAVHDMHIWTLSSSNYAMVAPIDMEVMTHWREVLPRLQSILRERFGIAHSTLQPEDAVIRSACDAGPDCGTVNADR